MNEIAVRTAAEADIPWLREIERSAGRAFAAVGMTAIAEDEPPSEQTLRGYVTEGRAWVAGEPPVAYLIAEPVDGALHIEQVSVREEYARRGIGRALIEHAAAWARERGIPALTLTTFTDVPWNAPYYRRLGFHPLAPDDLTPGLREIRAAEAAHGLDRWPRQAMRRNLPNINKLGEGF